MDDVVAGRHGLYLHNEVEWSCHLEISRLRWINLQPVLQTRSGLLTSKIEFSFYSPLPTKARTEFEKLERQQKILCVLGVLSDRVTAQRSMKMWEPLSERRLVVSTRALRSPLGTAAPTFLSYF